MGVAGRSAADSNRAALRTFDIELETLQNRVKKIEEKLGIGLI